MENSWNRDGIMWQEGGDNFGAKNRVGISSEITQGFQQGYGNVGSEIIKQIQGISQFSTYQHD